MPVQLSMRVRNGRLDAIETVMGASPTLRIRSGAPPANTAAVRTGTILSTIALPADWASDAANGQKALLGTWADVDGADADGAAGYFDIEGTGGIFDMQGNVTITGGGGVMEVSNTSFAEGQPFSVTAFLLNEPNE